MEIVWQKPSKSSSWQWIWLQSGSSCMKYLKLFISHCWYSLICLYFFNVSSRSIKFSTVLQQDILPGMWQWTQTECFLLIFALVVFVLVVILPTHPDHFVLVAPSTWMFGCRQWLVLYTWTGQNLLHFLLNVVPYSLSSLCLYLQWYMVKYDCLNTTGNVGRWDFVFVGTVKRCVYGKIFK